MLGMDDLISVGEAASLLQVSVSTVRRWFDSGRLRGKRYAGGPRKVLKQDVEVMVASSIHEPEDGIVFPRGA
jgi:excisionase family DNA binding protein